jgi:hypothetical protein
MGIVKQTTTGETELAERTEMNDIWIGSSHRDVSRAVNLSNRKNAKSYPCPISSVSLHESSCPS